MTEEVNDVLWKPGEEGVAFRRRCPSLHPNPFLSGPVHGYFKECGRDGLSHVSSS